MTNRVPKTSTDFILHPTVADANLKYLRLVRLESGGSVKSEGKLALGEPFSCAIVQHNTCQRA